MDLDRDCWTSGSEHITLISQLFLRMACQTGVWRQSNDFEFVPVRFSFIDRKREHVARRGYLEDDVDHSNCRCCSSGCCVSGCAGVPRSSSQVSKAKIGSSSCHGEDVQNEAEIEKVEATDGIQPNSTGSAHLSSQALHGELSDAPTGKMSTFMLESVHSGEMVDVIELDGKEHTATKVRAVTTLHSKLHKEKSLLHPQLIQRHLAFGLSQVLSTLQTKDALTQLTSHWVLFDNKDRMFLQIASGSGNGMGVSGWSLKNGINGSNEGLRWGAPEQKEDSMLSSNDVDIEKVSVFRLGLLLWEMETGEIPFKEVDAVNAHRQVVSGVRPDLTKVPDSSIRALIQNCLHQQPEHRPTLATVERDLSDLSSHVTRSVDNLAPLPLHN
ncbi:hypothetical protein BLNAU_20796 [Blattamonas nauphoetae]|uniref:Protein kinase domain-containing protein n=1 Tax=Blattamonas nauphoetae TaxID=2049346 RepID=A0ABQ9WXQ9_9EUKA|nr:hypothetical protein BLNAU_20796 [Blattamonas nauphoetae]